MTTDERLALIRDRHHHYLRDPLAVAARFVADHPEVDDESDEDEEPTASAATAWEPSELDELPEVLTVRGGEVRYGA